MPHPLDAATAARLRQAFQELAAPLDGLQDNILLGHVMAGRLLGASVGASRGGPEELQAWLERFPDLPDGPAIHTALLSRLPKGAMAPPAPRLANVAAPPPGDEIEPRLRSFPRQPALDRAVRDAARGGQADRALAIIGRARGIAPDYAALLKAEVAQVLFSRGDDINALAIAEAANRQARGGVALAPWIGGLAAWRLDRPELARTWFEAAWRAPTANPGRRAAAAFWAARATLVTRGNRGPWLQRAAHEPRTFYGLLARRVLGQPVLAPAPTAVLGEADIEAVGATARGERAFALLQVGQAARAAAELSVLWAETRDKVGFARSILLVAQAAGLGELAAQLDASLTPASARLPASRLRPAGGFKVDPALVYALARLESNFDAAAVSPSGARGLMQVMPGTAQFLLAGTGRAVELHDPAVNLEIGQRYLLRLGTFESIGSDLVRTLAAYNAGVGNFGRWLEAMGPQDDPLLFMEALPGAETRAYVPRALAYSWLYAAQLGLPCTSLDELAAGLWPRVQARQPWKEAAVRLH